DQRRAVVVGERTYGKGSVQELIPLEKGGAVKLTTRRYYLPSGTCIQKPPDADKSGASWGVEPNVVVRMPDREGWLKHWLTAAWALPSSQPASAPAATVASQVGAAESAHGAAASQPQSSAAATARVATPTSEDDAEAREEAEEAARVARMLEWDPQLARGLE